MTTQSAHSEKDLREAKELTAKIKEQAYAWHESGDEFDDDTDEVRWHEPINHIIAISLAAARAEGRGEIERLEKLVYVPGLWRCAKCKCETVCTNLHVQDGSFSANNEPQECPNNCGPMWRVTERDAGNRLIDRIPEITAKARKAALEEAIKAIWSSGYVTNSSPHADAIRTLIDKVPG